MALLFMDGFDAGDIATKWVAGATFSASSSITRFGTGMVAAQSGSSDTLLRSITASAQITIGAAFYVTTGTCGITIRADSGATTHLSILRSADSGIIEVRRGTAAGTIIAQGTTMIPLATWNYIEVQATIADSGGIARVRLNGSSTNEINFSGDTKNAGTSTNIDVVGLVTQFSTSARFDDVYVLNSTGSANTTFLGDIRIHPLSPNNNGTNSQLTGSDGNQTDNYQLVDERPFSTADYVGSPTVGQRDTYALEDLPSVTQIFGVQNNFVGAKSDASAGNAKSALLINSTLYYGSTRALGTSYIAYSDIYDTNPNTSTAWTSGAVNGMEAGMEVA